MRDKGRRGRDKHRRQKHRRQGETEGEGGDRNMGNRERQREKGGETET